jgi:hypothetical protein
MPRTAPLVCVQTWFRKDGRYELELASAQDAQTKLRFITTNRAIYDAAAQIEGTDARIEVVWQWADGQTRVVEAVYLSNGAQSR